MRLAVELHATRVGTLEGDARSFDFMPSPEAIELVPRRAPTLSSPA